MTPLQYRILEIAYPRKLSHLGSCLSAAPILDEIYKQRSPTDPVILSQGHAGLALYVVLEKYLGKNAEDLLDRHGIHPNRSESDGIYYSTGSLGCGITAACGFALANRGRSVYCFTSDGECAEPDVFGALNFAREFNLNNLHVHVNINGFSAYKVIDKANLKNRLLSTWDKAILHFTDYADFPFLNGLDAHYKVLTDEDYKKICAKT